MEKGFETGCALELKWSGTCSSVLVSDTCIPCCPGRTMKFERGNGRLDGSCFAGDYSNGNYQYHDPHG
ncbi:hypothetical protein CLOSTASPAR_01586 [[Clostridium] asparagiforme DSM 15981]|uniref:Uncharacterized protein n=1 Tax=[Clostridium] asparagiforme DSM 15981 TaxID=518636 RepID=C0CX65_9FIRM|nr:hypothetical protein CLOSTASPAR_01586 [[Clostridium] asparagiforme DSM 15981]